MDIKITTKDGENIVISVPDHLVYHVSVENRDPIPGDVNGDGKVDHRDAMLIMEHLSGDVDLDDDERKAADVDGDGSVTYLDAMSVMDQLNRGTAPEVGE